MIARHIERILGGSFPGVSKCSFSVEELYGASSAKKKPLLDGRISFSGPASRIFEFTQFEQPTPKPDSKGKVPITKNGADPSPTFSRPTPFSVVSVLQGFYPS